MWLFLKEERMDRIGKQFGPYPVVVSLTSLSGLPIVAAIRNIGDPRDGRVRLDVVLGSAMATEGVSLVAASIPYGEWEMVKKVRWIE